MFKPQTKKNIITSLIVIAIVILAVPLIVHSQSSGGSSAGGCCGGGCCGDNTATDTQGDGGEVTEDKATSPAVPSQPTICETKGLRNTKVDLGLTVTNLSNHYEYAYTYSIIACSQDVSYTITLEGDRFYTADAGRIVKNGSIERSGSYSSEQVKNFERDYNLFKQICVATTDPGVAKTCVNRK